jgi:ABC-type multidrug transport system fused ATPase/permease subunit
MQGWWRVLRGVKPYMWSVVLSMICALGVGLSYASGVAVLLPVMKIFVSDEGIHGWANRAAAQYRLDVDIADLNETLEKNVGFKRNANNPLPPAEIGLIITKTGPSQTARELAVDKNSNRIITEVDIGGRKSSRWQDMLLMIMQAPSGQPVMLKIAGFDPVQIPLRDLPWYTQIFARTVDLLPADAFQSLLWVVAFFIFLCIIGSTFRYYQQFLGMNVANRVVMDIRRRMYDRVVQLPTSYFAQKGTADAMSRLTTDTNTLTDGVSMALGKAIQEPVKAAFSFGLALWIDWRLCLLVVLSMPVLGIIIRKFSKRMRRASRRALENWARMLAVINETLIGARVVKAYSGEGYERRRFARVNKDLLKEQIRLNHYASLSRPTIETLAVMLSSIPMMFAARLVLNGTVDVSHFMTLLACFTAMLEPLRKLSDVNAKVQITNAAATRVFEVMDLEIEPNHKHSLPKLPRHQRTIEFRDIVFSYPGHEEIILNHINVTVNAGQNVAVVGGNGSGKTTLLQLLPRLYIPTSGQIIIDGVDIGTVSLRSLRKQIGLVTQDTLLFADTIYNNIAYGSRHATHEQILEAARRSYADEFIRGFPEGYDTRVGEHGVRLSGGQKQRIAIARAILHDPSILILDEAMSQVDSDSEQKITDALRAFTRNRTTFMIAHRFQSVVSADMIICLEKGLVAGIGIHNQLLETCPPYRRLYENQFRESA